ncbi:hypothetical protein IB227_12050 [Stenotrophomonas sp. STM01]|jgi:hypothetical protein|uniref:hypothetical protein n=1 Tax=Stenotrophomonas sp. STM01 TaxID=2769278 RepID=UPI001784A9E7|nr:hypothetical protein [Stenotrophomonas sp. STM01]MBD9536582.1 hypothetical protein [Stenotrophomonas sp. STM01]
METSEDATTIRLQADAAAGGAVLPEPTPAWHPAQRGLPEMALPPPLALPFPR